MVCRSPFRESNARDFRTAKVRDCRTIHNLPVQGNEAFVAEIKRFFEPWQLADFLERAHQSEPFDPSLFEPTTDLLFGVVEIKFGAVEVDAEEVEGMRKDDIRQCTRELLLVERARE